MRRMRLALLSLALAGIGCAYLPADPNGSNLVCRNDAECGEGQVCFLDGCGDPGQHIVVEVTPNPKAGLHAQDFAVENLRPQQNLELFGPATLQGQVRRETLLPAPESSTTAYSSPVSVRVSGESLLIPGLMRRHEATLLPDNGNYQLAVGSGSYTILLLAADPQVPPQTAERVVEPGKAVPLDFLLPAPTAVTRLAGKVVRLNTTLVEADLEVQALDDNLRPLSQRVPVTRGTGDFLLALPPSAAKLDHVLVQVTPPRADTLVPQKTFTVDPRPGVTEALDLGEYGEPVTVQGRVVDRDGKPVANASVYLQGKVGGGGQLRTRPVTTGTDGRFELLSLPSHPDTPMTLYAVPPTTASAGITLQPTAIPRGGVTLSDIICPDKVIAEGTLMRPEGLPAAGVRVVAEPVGEVTGWPRPAVGTEAGAATDEDGRYRLRLDPGEYRFDFIPAENLPRVSRFVTVLPATNLELAPFTLSKGRRINGLVTIHEQQVENAPPGIPYASIRFFRVVNVEGKPTSVLLAQTVADSTGNYAATLPTR
ncbi:MAG TPA: carboxypeptidase regulatory-like domain-containing protein [Hyalangium sp.]|nr:carboxypeptidase regulatory-like domain-containing protein [Hyalangium sp.]